MPKITFLPINQSYEVSDGESILEVAIQNDVPLMHACGGFCACTTCHVKVQNGSNKLSPIEEDERERLESTADNVESNSRLGCQAKIYGDVVVEIMNLEE